ncbi:MAG TPA: response regulator transcription factor [Polyangiaceae bacterium]|nr:response regulator transcription factor [Polyangiaceae bacterium]
MSRGSAALRVLVADDARAVAERIAGLVLDSGSQVSLIGPAFDGSEALTLFERERPDLALIDLHMPGLDGLQLTRSIRKADEHCRVVVLTSHLEPVVREECLAAGAECVLDKVRELGRLELLLREEVERRSRASGEPV